MFIIGTPHTHNAGYYRNDDTPAGGKLVQGDVQTCTHCQRVLIMQKWKEEGAWCGKCNAPICTFCGTRAVTYGCEPFLKQLELHTDALIKFQQHLKIAGLDTPVPPQSIVTG